MKFNYRCRFQGSKFFIIAHTSLLGIAQSILIIGVVFIGGIVYCGKVFVVVRKLNACRASILKLHP